MSKKSTPTFLITAIGSLSADAVIRSIRYNYAPCRIIGTDSHNSEWLYLSKQVDVFYRMPKANEPFYIKKVTEICLKHDVDFIIPLTDSEVDVLSIQQEHLENYSSTLTLSSKDSITICRDKWLLSQRYANHPGIKIIETLTIKDIKSKKLTYPLVAKPKRGRSSEGLKYIQTAQELQGLDSSYIIQEFLNGEIITVDFVRDRHGHMVSLSRKELVRTANGAGISVQVIRDQKLEEIVNMLGQDLSIIGCINAEFIKKDAEYYLMDLNPRFSAGVGFSHKAGYDFVLNHIRAFSNQLILPIKEIREEIFMRHYYIH